MDARAKLQAVKRRLGEPRQEARRKGEFGFLCPGKPGSGGCSSAPEGKVRLWVNPSRDEFHCWHCGFGGKSLAALMVPGSPEQREYLDGRPARGCRVAHLEELPRCTALPEGYRPFTLDGSRDEAPYLTYLRGRGLTDHTLALYRMGYVDSGHLRRRVVIPSFDSHGMLNFWSARSIDVHDPRDPSRYRLPVASKDVVSNEHMVDWSQPVYLVEGIFDEVALGPQAISLYGKFLPPSLALRLVERRPPQVMVCLDSDALPEAHKLMSRIVGYDIPCSLVHLPGKDPAEAGAQSELASMQVTPAVTGAAGMLRVRI